MNGIEFSIVDPDFYRPIDRLTGGTTYAPARPPHGWRRDERDVWTRWTPQPAPAGPAQGWKVHVSARRDRTQHVLDAVAEVCGRHGVPFKHVRNERLFLWLHHKHGPRPQSGKFCTAYPPDEAAARALMADLAAALPDEPGPYVLTDRRFGSSSVVSYRYGAFAGRYAVQPDGTRLPVLTDGTGADVLDDRQPRFTLPAGVTDPFAAPPPAPTGGGPVTVNGYAFTAVLQFSNAGGAYRATAPDGRTVFVKEARRDNGYQWDGSTARERLRREHETLRALHAAEPGICPAPVDYFRHWEHEFLVTELVPGVPLLSWTSQHNPVARTAPTPAMFDDYHERCRAILARLRALVDRLHAAGYAFVDLNPRNVLVDEDDGVRLIDFEEAQRLDAPRPVHGAEGFLPPRTADRERGALHADEYGLAAMAQLLVFPLHPVLDRHPAALAHLTAALPAVPEDLWRGATLFRESGSTSVVPDPDEVAADPDKWLAWLGERVADGIAAMCAPGEPMPFPLGPTAYATNPHGLGYGTAGVLYALRRHGSEVDRRLVTGLLDRVRADLDTVPPGLLTGTAGLAWTFAELGEVDAARDLLRTGSGRALAKPDSTVAHGAAGIALTHLALHRHDGDPGHVARAAELLAGVPDGDELEATLGPQGMTGWLYGRPGIALALRYLHDHVGDPALIRRGRSLLLADLAESYSDGPGIQFHVSRTDRRVEPYLATGTAGFALVAGRYLTGGDDPLDLAYQRCLATLRSPLLPVLPALLNGLAGIGSVLADLSTLTGAADLRSHALRAGGALFTYAVPRDDTIAFLGSGNRFTTDLAEGAAGILLFLSQIRDERADALFTLDPAPTRGTPPATSRRRH